MVFGLAAKAQSDTICIKTYDLAENYGLQPDFLYDTNALANYLSEQKLDYQALHRTCQAFAIGAQSMIDDLDHDFRNGIVWLDATHYIGDFGASRSMLTQLVTRANRFAAYYKQLEEQRLEEERQEALAQEKREQLKLQEERSQLLEDLKSQITNSHRTISSICDGTGITDKAKLKDLKDIYYSYLMVYNKFDMTATVATPKNLESLRTLNEFQEDLLNNVLGTNSYINQIVQFREDLRFATAKDFSDIYKSYNKMFKKTAVAANFSNIETYEQYTQRLKDIITVQRSYLKVIELYNQINQTTTTIVELYGKRYKDVGSAYKSVADGMYLVPAFTTLEESQNFISRLENFIEVQKIYIANYRRLETIQLRGDSIVHSCLKKNYDIVIAYRDLLASTSFVGTYKTIGEAENYALRLDNFERLQYFYQEIVELRTLMSLKDDTITTSKTIEKVLLTGYKTLRKTTIASPRFNTLEQGQQYVNQIYAILDMQDACIAAILNQDQIARDKNFIEMQGKVYPNIAKAYNRIERTYDYTFPIMIVDDIYKYMENQKRHMVAQRIFKEAFNSMDASAINQRLKRISDVEKIKLILNIK